MFGPSWWEDWEVPRIQGNQKIAKALKIKIMFPVDIKALKGQKCHGDPKLVPSASSDVQTKSQELTSCQIRYIVLVIIVVINKANICVLIQTTKIVHSALSS